MRTLLDAPFGKVLLTVVALGIAAFRVFVFFRPASPSAPDRRAGDSGSVRSSAG